MMPGTARPGDRAVPRWQAVQPPEQRAQPAESAVGADRLTALLPGHRVSPLGHQHGAAVQGRDRLAGRAALGRKVAGRQVLKDLRVTGCRCGWPAGRKPPGHPVGTVGAPDPPHADVEVGHRGHVDPVLGRQV
jgi:hypothetical protein